MLKYAVAVYVITQIISEMKGKNCTYTQWRPRRFSAEGNQAAGVQVSHLFHHPVFHNKDAYQHALGAMGMCV